PEKNGDYAWLLHILKSLKPKGKAAVILPHGVLFRGNAEALIRRNIIDKGYIKGIIALPANLFYGTGIPACIIVIDKEGAAERDGIFMIDASHDFIKDGNKNRLRERDIYKIVTTDAEDRAVLESLLEKKNLVDEYKKMLKTLKEILEQKIKKQYGKLTNDEILELLVNRKWYNTIYEGIHALYTAISHNIANRVTELAARYEEPLPAVAERVVEYESKVKSHLERMGFAW
ncbi:MAG: SAM-dependent methyltransferase, partial [Treponema sp.]|nr:SAM-dependent methyltransferase [Treponema sp.]